MRFIILFFSLIALSLGAQSPNPHSQDKVKASKVNEASLAYLDSIRYISKKDLLTIHFNFNTPLKESQISKTSKKYFSIADIAPIKPTKKTPPILLKNLYVFSDKNTLFIAPDATTPLDISFKLSQDKKTVIFQLSPMLKSQSPISNTQYIAAILILILAFLVLFFIKRKLKSSFTSPLTFHKYFIDSKSFVLELNMKGVRYFILSTPRGQILLDSEPKAAFNDLLNSMDKKQNKDHANFPKKTDIAKNDEANLLEKLNLKLHKDFYTSPNISKELDKNTSQEIKQEASKAQDAINELSIQAIISQAKPIHTYTKALQKEEASSTNTTPLTKNDDLESIFPSKQDQNKQDEPEYIYLSPTQTPSKTTQSPSTPKPQVKKPAQIQKAKPSQSLKETNKIQTTPPNVTFLKDEDYEHDDEEFEYEDNDALLNDFFSQVHEPTIKDKLSSRLKGILRPFKKNEKE